LNRYGSREVGLIASECKHQKGLHINADNIYVEIVKNGKSVSNGDSGDILVTDLTNHAMPLIRYKLGDVGRLSNNDCTCGRNLPLMKSVEGRTGDFFVSSNGSLVHGEYFTHLFYGEGDVIKFQMIQETISEINLKIVSVNNDINADYLHGFISKTKTMLGNNCEVNIEFVSNIPLPASGKTIFTISKVAR
jgi:phenylacetate-CoA ligase